MKICLVTPSPVPFVMGGAEKLFLGLVEAINHHTSHVADLIKIPVFEQGFWGLVDGYRLFAELDLSHFDLVISTKYPAWMIRHKNHHVYLQHKLRGFYDLYQAAPQGLKGGEPRSAPRALPDHPSLQGLLAILDRSHPDRKDMDDLFAELGRLRHLRLPENIFVFPGPLIRRVVHFLDQIGLSSDNIVSYSAISRTVANRKDYFPAGVPVRVLHHPTSLKGLAPGTKQDYLFTASRLSELKRLHLLVAAYARVPGNLPFLIAGTGAEEFTLARQAAHDPRIQFLGFVPDAQLSQLYRDALAVPFVPYDEDYGLITLEAMRCAKPVLTCSDSGGVTELVQSGVTGEIATPTVESIAGLLANLVENPARSQDLGRNALERVRPITWSNFVRDLLDQVSLPRIVRTPSTSAQPRGHILVLSTFGVHPPLQGGQLRIFHLYRQLTNHYDVTILSLGNLDAPEEAIEMAPGYVEHRIPRVKAQAREEMRLKDLSGISCGDIMVITHWAQNNRFMDVLQEYLSSTDCVVLSHPYMAHALQECWDGPVV
ncbi:MAG: glycosyltransferase, partial [Desulfovibrionales bacterium]|nr:glycosyltransferase [Desulfovibrionales bacterium]